MTDYSRAEMEFERLKAQFESGALTEAEFKSQLEELMLEDEQGQWWIIGYESGLWYYHDGKAWIQSDPPPVIQRREQAEALYTEGTAALSAGDWQSAAEHFQAVLDLEQDHAQALAGLEEARAKAQAEAQAVADAAVAATVEPEPPALTVPETEAEVEALPPEPKSRTVWIVAAVIVVIIVAIVLIQIFPLGTPEPALGIWAERDVIQPGQCTPLHWEAPGFEGVRVVGPGTDSSVLMPPVGDLEVCPEATSWYELKGPEWEELSRVQVHVGE